ncbi:MAG: serine hydrolase, partial [Pseudonocardiaceae bacterium]
MLRAIRRACAAGACPPAEVSVPAERHRGDTVRSQVVVSWPPPGPRAELQAHRFAKQIDGMSFLRAQGTHRGHGPGEPRPHTGAVGHVPLRGGRQSRVDVRLPRPDLISVTGPVAARGAPRGTFAYGNGGYAMLGQLIADLTASRYEDAATRMVLEPLGMSSSWFPRSPPATGVATGHRLTDEGVFERAPGSPSPEQTPRRASAVRPPRGGRDSYCCLPTVPRFPRSRAGAVCERASRSSSARCPPVIDKAPATIPPPYNRSLFKRHAAGLPPSAVLLRNATPSVLHQRHIGRVLRSSCNPRGRRLASSRGREPQPGRCPSLWPGD